MAQELFAPQADMVDGELFVETTETAKASAALWRVLDLTRQKPRPWIPTVVLAGEHGSGLTTIAKRFVMASQRNVACDLLHERIGDLEPEQARRAAEAKTHASQWAERMVREHGGSCPGICQPAAWVPEHLVQQILADTQGAHPAVRLQMAPRADRDGTWLASRVWRSPGNVAHHPRRRTSIMMIDHADRLLAVPASRRRTVLDRIDEWERVPGHPLALVLIGSPALASAVSEFRTTQVIHLDAMANDGNFTAVSRMIFGVTDPAAVAALHTASGGLMGRLIHLARMRGIEPPFAVEQPDTLLRLPALPAPGKPA